jgi:hypothetical protein
MMKGAWCPVVKVARRAGVSERQDQGIHEDSTQRERGGLGRVQPHHLCVGGALIPEAITNQRRLTLRSRGGLALSSRRFRGPRCNSSRGGASWAGLEGDCAPAPWTEMVRARPERHRMLVG